jgi:hypothetical protein
MGQSTAKAICAFEKTEIRTTNKMGYVFSIYFEPFFMLNKMFNLLVE